VETGQISHGPAGRVFCADAAGPGEGGLLAPIQLQLLHPRCCRSRISRLPTKAMHPCGIEFDLIGRRVAYPFAASNPGDSTDSVLGGAETVRVPAEDVLHISVYRRRAIRGLSGVAPPWCGSSARAVMMMPSLTARRPPG